MLRSMALVALIATAGAAHAAEQPWPGDRWRADVTEVRQGRTLHTTIVGAETHTERGTRITVTCRSSDGRSLRGRGYGLMRQDDFESGLALGTLSIHYPDHVLRWLDGSACAQGEITWHKL